MKINQEYLKEFYQYLLQNGFTVTKAKSNFGIVSYNLNKIYAYKSDNHEDLKSGEASNYYHEKFYSENQFKEFIQNKFHRIHCIKHEHTELDFFIKFYKTTTKENRLELFKEIETILGYVWHKDFLKIIDSVSNNKKEIIANIHSFPVSVLKFQHVNLKNLHIFFMEHDFNEEELDNFYYKFFKSRKNQIKGPIYGPKFRDFLLEIYGRNEEKLKPYFEFSNYVKQEFHNIDLNFIELISNNVIATRINCRKASKLLCIPYYGEIQINSEISSFVHAIKDFMNFDQVTVEYFDKPKCINEVRCYTNTDFSKEELNNLIKEYLLFKKTEPNFETNKSNVEKWLMQRNLKLHLREQPITAKSKQIKI